MPEALLGSRFCNAWKASKVEILTLDKVTSAIGKSVGDGKSYEESVNTE